MITCDELQDAACVYPDHVYPEEPYLHCLGILESATGASPQVADAVCCLFLWKLGKLHPKRTPTAVHLPLLDATGRRYWGAGITGANERGIRRATRKETLQAGIGFRDGALSYSEFRPHASGLTEGSIVLPAFYVHIWRPAEYPMLDRNVWRVFREESGKQASRWTLPRSWQHYANYRRFFRRLAARCGLPWRTIDKGLWVLGDVVGFGMGGACG